MLGCPLLDACGEACDYCCGDENDDRDPGTLGFMLMLVVAIWAFLWISLFFPIYESYAVVPPQSQSDNGHGTKVVTADGLAQSVLHQIYVYGGVCHSFPNATATGTGFEGWSCQSLYSASKEGLIAIGALDGCDVPYWQKVYAPALVCLVGSLLAWGCLVWAMFKAFIRELPAEWELPGWLVWLGVLDETWDEVMYTISALHIATGCAAMACSLAGPPSCFDVHSGAEGWVMGTGGVLLVVGWVVPTFFLLWGAWLSGE